VARHRLVLIAGPIVGVPTGAAYRTPQRGKGRRILGSRLQVNNGGFCQFHVAGSCQNYCGSKTIAWRPLFGTVQIRERGRSVPRALTPPHVRSTAPVAWQSFSMSERVGFSWVHSQQLARVADSVTLQQDVRASAWFWTVTSIVREHDRKTIFDYVIPSAYR